MASCIKSAMKLFTASLTFIVLLLPSFGAQPEKPSVASRTAGLEKHAGFLPFYWDEKKGELFLELSPAALSREFLYFTGLGSGIGSTNVFADRSTFGDSALCRFRRAGKNVLVIRKNTGFRATEGSPGLKRSVEYSFPTSVLAALPIEADESGTLLVNAQNLVIRDAVDLLSQLRRPTRAVGGMLVRDTSAKPIDWRIDKDRSVIDLEQSGSFPLNTEIEALLTFTTDAETDLNQPDPHVVSVREHHSFLALPEAGYEIREQDPRVGYFATSFQDFAQPYDHPLNRYLVNRWRLQKKDPDAALSDPVKPLVFYLDPAIPEPARSAARRGALWWNQAFEQAGFKNALRLEDLPEGASPMDVRYPTIQWTNRSGRGWSVGQSHADPRTGEILHAVVQLDSHRMRTVNNYWQATLPSGRNGEDSFDLFAALDNLDPKLDEEQVMQARLALLTCHEMGHVLGLEHNFVASTYNRGSVMDYFAPRVHIRPDGTADLSDAYMQGVGSYDRFAIQWGYSQGKSTDTAEQEHARLDAIVKDSTARGIVWGNYNDPRWNSYDDGPDPLTWLKEVQPVRDTLLAHFGPQMLRPGEPNSALASRFPLIYLFHRYALAAAVRTVGSAKIPLSLAGDGQPVVDIWPAESQNQAVDSLIRALAPDKIEVQKRLWEKLAPVENRDPDPEAFSSSATYLFSPEDGARAISEIVVGGLLDPERMERLQILSGYDSRYPSPTGVISRLVTKEFEPEHQPSVLSDVVRQDLAHRLMILSANADATPEVRASALAGISQLQKALESGRLTGPISKQIAHQIKLFLENPQQNTPKLKPSGAPPGPPV